MLNRRRSVAFWINYALAILYALIVVTPIYFVVVSSFKDNAGIFNSPLGLPATWGLDNYAEVESRVGMLRAIGVSVAITTLTLLMIVFVGFLAAYAIARIAPKFKNPRIGLVTEAFFGLGFLIPAFALLVPVFLLAARSGLLYNPIYLVTYYLAANLPLSILLLSSYMRSIPRDLEEAAEIDGANRVQIIRCVIFPLMRSGIVTIVVLNFINVWNEYIFALLLLDSNYRTAQVAIPLLRTVRSVDYGLISAGVVFALIPVYIVFTVFQERIITGMRAGSVK